MSYLVLARKFRPQRFDSVIGQEHVTKALANAIVRGRVPHALLFTGPRGVGKTTCARVFARAVNCINAVPEEDLLKLDEEEARRRVEPCGECVNCEEIAKSTSIAVREIDGASNNSVENVRELIETLRSLPPPGTRYKIYIIDEVHMLSTAAFNALLKSLEEPPPNTLFVFATTEPHKIPETVVSRCQRHDFRNLLPSRIAECLRKIADAEGINVNDEVLYLIARKAQGGMRDAQSMFDRLIAFSFDRIELSEALLIFGFIDPTFFFDLSRAVLEKDIQRCFTLLDQAFAQSIDLRSFLSDFVTHWRNLLLLALSSKQGTQQADTSLTELLQVSEREIEELKKLIGNVTDLDTQRLFDLAESTASSALRSNYPRYVLEAGLAKMATLPSLRPIPELIERLEQLKKGQPLSTGRRVQRHTSPAVQSKRSNEQTVARLEQGTGSAEEEYGEQVFNPSWQAFVAHVHSRSEPVLAAHLRRVSPSAFSEGELKIEASEFDIDALAEENTQKMLRSCLYSYSGLEKWRIRFEKHNGSGERVVRKGRAAKAKPVAGSIAAQEIRAEDERRARIDEEARNHPVTKAVLETFDGSKIERVSILKR